MSTLTTAWHFTNVPIRPLDKSNPRFRPSVIERVSGEGNPYDNPKKKFQTYMKAGQDAAGGKQLIQQIS